LRKVREPPHATSPGLPLRELEGFSWFRAPGVDFTFTDKESGRADSNRRPPAPHAGALAWLRHAPCYHQPSDPIRPSDLRTGRPSSPSAGVKSWGTPPFSLSDKGRSRSLTASESVIRTAGSPSFAVCDKRGVSDISAFIVKSLLTKSSLSV
jgi:hypothetical protein